MQLKSERSTAVSLAMFMSFIVSKRTCEGVWLRVCVGVYVWVCVCACVCVHMCVCACVREGKGGNRDG